MGWAIPSPHYFEDRHGARFSTAPAFASMTDNRKATLWSILHRVGERMTYHLGFEEDWEHEVELETVLESRKRPGCAECLAGKRRCPPDDCGGPFGFRDLLHAIADQRRSKLPGAFHGWLEGRFDPAVFEPMAVNSALRRIKV